MFEKEKDRISSLFSNAQEYLRVKEALWKLTLIEKTSRVSSVLASFILIGSIFLFFFVFLSIALAYLLSEYYGKASIGFSLVALLFLFISLLLYIKREAWLIKPVMNSMIRNLTNEKDEEDK